MGGGFLAEYEPISETHKVNLSFSLIAPLGTSRGQGIIVVVVVVLVFDQQKKKSPF